MVEERCAARLVATKAAARMANLGVASAWNSWVQMSGERRQGLEPMRKAVARLVFRQQSLCFSAWQERWAGDRAMRQALCHLLQQGLSRGWAALVEERGAGHECSLGAVAMRQVLRYMLHRGLSRGWNAWVSMAAECERMAAERQRTRSCLARMMHRELSVGWNAWTTMLSERGASLMMISRALARVVNQGVAKAWSSWVELLEERRRCVEPLSKGLARLMNRQLSLCFNAWQERWAGDRAMRQALRHLLQDSLSRGWSAWRSMLAECEAEQKHLARMKSSIAHMVHRELSIGWNAWTSMVEERCAARLVASKAAARMANLGVASAWSSWVQM